MNNFIYSSVESTSSGNVSFSIDVGFVSSVDIPGLINKDYQSRYMTSIDELFLPFTTYSGYFGPKADFTTPSGTRGSGDARPEVYSCDVSSGINYGICPTFDDNAPTANIDIFDKNDTIKIRSVAFKNPMMFAGFGYTAEGLPFPSEYDRKVKESGTYYFNTTSSGIFENPDHSGEYRRDILTYASGYKERCDLWRAGPLDLRWEPYKKMYVASPEVFVGYALQDIPAASGRTVRNGFTSGLIGLYTGRYSDYYPSSGNNLMIINRSIGTDIQSGTLIVAIRTNNGENMPIWVDCEPDI